MDLKAIMTIMKIGGGSFNTDYFCPFCQTRCHKRGMANIDKCNKCIEKNRAKCFCCPIVHGETIEMYCSDGSQVPQRKFDSFVQIPKSDDKKDDVQKFLEVINN